MFDRKKAVIDLRQKLKDGKVSIGSWMQLNSPDVAEIMGQAGFDWISVDMEHGSISSSDLPNLFRALELGNTLPLARISEGTLTNCKQALDAGAGGLIIPMILDEKQLKEIISWCCWPPKGVRGVGYSRANLFGKHFDVYNQESQTPLIVAQIEHIKAVENLEEILKIEGLDAIFIGPYDLSASMGLTGSFEHPDYIEVVKKIVKIAKIASIPAGIHVIEPNQLKLKNAINEGYKLLAFSIDGQFILSCSKYKNVIDSK